MGAEPILRVAPIKAISLGLLALMVSGPFLLPYYTPPIASFWNEWWAGALGLAAAIFGLLAARSRWTTGALPLSPLLAIPVVLLGTLLLQFLLGRLVFPQLGLLYSAYLLWAALLLTLGRHLANTIGLERLADILALAIALGALIGGAVALVQWLGIADRVPWIYPSQGGAIRANIGQTNHHAHYSWLGIASAFYLRGRGFLSRGLFWFLVLTIGFGSVLSSSRSVFLYLLVLLAALGWARHRDPQGAVAKLVVDAALLMPVLVALNFFGAWASPRVSALWTWFGGMSPSLDLGGIAAKAGGAVMPGVQLYEQITGSSDRLAEIRSAWSAFVEHPWLGQGAGNFLWASFEASAGRADWDYLEIAEHAHNIVFQLLAEFGAPATVAVILLLFFWARQFLRQPWRLEHFWCAAVLGIGAVHSLLEYPLWYSYFLGPTALLLGATDGRKSFTVAGQRVTAYLVMLTMVGTLILVNLRADYLKIEAAAEFPLVAHTDRKHDWQMHREHLNKLQHESLLSPWILRAFAYTAEPGRQFAQARASQCERGIRLAPDRSLVTRCAMQLAIAGRTADARKLALAVLRAYPVQRMATVKELEKGAQTFPEVEPLWAISKAQ